MVIQMETPKIPELPKDPKKRREALEKNIGFGHMPDDEPGAELDEERDEKNTKKPGPKR